MIDARTWTPPSADELRERIAAAGLPRWDLAARAGTSERRLREWISATKPREITYQEWAALDRALAALEAQKKRVKSGWGNP